MAELKNFPKELGSVQVLIRFCLRMIILAVFASLASIGFGRSFAALPWMSTILSLIVAAMKRESPLDSILTHRDEAAAYGSLWCLTCTFNQLPPV
jgi:cbb3-type cytochrome oxidase subunit 1